MRGAAALILVAALGGCVDLSTPPELERPEAGPADAGAAESGLGPSPDAGAPDLRDGAVVDVAVVGSDAADAAAIDVAVDLAAGVDATDTGRDLVDAMADLPAPDVALPPPDVMPDLPPDVVDTTPPPDTAPPLPVISFTDMSMLVYVPGTGGTTTFAASCPGTTQAITGVIGTSGGVMGLNSVQGSCGGVEATGTPPALQLVTRPGSSLGPYGPVRSTVHDGSCPANQVIVGFEGGSGSWINYLYVYCAALTISGSPGGYTVSIGVPTRHPTQLGMMGGTPFAAHYCPAGQVAVGILGAHGSAIDRFGLYCARPVAR